MPRTRYRGLIAAGAVIVAGLAVSPDAVQAGCGDYVMIRGRHVAMSHGSGGHQASVPFDEVELSALSDDAIVPDEGQAASGSRRTSCRGPHCRDGSAPPSAPLFKISVSIERWAHGTRESAPELCLVSEVFAEPREAVAEGLGLSILRPPR